MNREILFRGQTRKKGEKVKPDGSPVDSNWTYGGVFQGKGDYSLIYSHGDCKKYPVYSETVGQFTGLTDKNGTKIFEGDIVKVSCDGELQCRTPVVWGHGSFETDGMCMCLAWADNLELEIIGNVFDNPELLEENNT